MKEKRFIQVEIEVYDKELYDLGIAQSDIFVNAMIDIDEICSIKEMVNEPNKSCIYLKNAESFIINISFPDAVHKFTK